MSRISILAIACAFVCATIIARFFQVQVIEGERWSQVVERSQMVNEPLPPLRGRILDRNGRPMADTRPLYHLGVVIEDVALGGRNRRVPLYVLDRARWLALGSDLGTRMAWAREDKAWHVRLSEALLAEPSVAVRGARGEALSGGLITVSRTVFDTTDPDNTDLAMLAGSDLLHDDPVEAIARELARVLRSKVEVFDEARLVEVCQHMDSELGCEPGRTWEVLVPYGAVCEIDIPLADPPLPQPGQNAVAAPPPRRLRVRWMTTQTLRRALELLATMIEESDASIVTGRWERLVKALPVQVPHSDLVYGAASQADAIVTRLPPDLRIGEIALPPASEPDRVLIIQGDPLDGDGAYSDMLRRVAGQLGIGTAMLDGLIRRHGEEILPGVAEKRWGKRFVVIDHAALERLCEGLAQAFTSAGITWVTQDVRAAIAAARRSADQDRAGATRFDPIIIRRDVPAALARSLDGAWVELPNDLAKGYDWPGPVLPGLRLVPGVGRAWPGKDSAVHVLGMLAPDPEGAWPGALKGVTGLEKHYDLRLRGAPGQRLRKREPEGLREAGTPVLPVHGQDVRCEIDADLQMVAEDALEHRLQLAKELGTWTERMERAAAVGKGRAGMVLMDCRTGALLVLASNPRYDPETVRERWNDLIRDPAGPLHDWSCEADQPPGSSFKILTMLCGLEKGVVSPGQVIRTKGYMALDRSGKKILADHAPAGDYDLAEGIQKSSNCYSADIAERLHRQFGPGLLSEYAKRFYLGRRPGLDIDQARAGLMPTPLNLRQLRPNEPTWRISDTWRMGIGQFCAASPLQVVTIAAAVANGGHIVQPFLVRPANGVVVSDDIQVRQEWLADVRHGMELVTRPGGTARYLVLEGSAAGILVAAKTGTSEWGSEISRKQERTPDHAWLIGYAPADKPTVAFACFVHSGTFGGLACTPIVKRVLEAYFSAYGRTGHDSSRATP